MPIIQFSQKDLLRGKTVAPAWYRVHVDSVGEQPTVTQKGPSTNYPVEVTIMFNGDTGDTQFAGVPVDWNFNSKAIGMARGFLESFGVSVTAGTRFDLKSAEGRDTDVYIGNDTWEGRIINKCKMQFRAPRADVQAVAQQVNESV